MLFKDSQGDADQGARPKDFLDEFSIAIWPLSLPTIDARDTNELTYLPPIHIYRDTYLSSL
jgi:hypothetical protein